MNIAICDDNRKFVKSLKKDLLNLSTLDTIVEEFYNGEELTIFYEEFGGLFDVVFLDMEMDGINGIEAANKIRTIDKHVKIVFVTSYEGYMRDSFQCRPFDFLIKPVSIEKITTLYNIIEQSLVDEPKAFVFMEDKEHVRLLYDDILYIENDKHVAWIHTKSQGVRKISYGLGSVLKSLDPNVFFRTHNSYAINLKYFKYTEDYVIHLYETDAQIPLSKSKKKLFKKLLERKEEEYGI